MSKIAPRGTLHLYEIVNFGRRESLLALVADGLASLLVRLKSPRPKPIAHWEPAEEFAVEQIAAAMPVSDAERFLKSYVASVRWRNWKILVWRG